MEPLSHLSKRLLQACINEYGGKYGGSQKIFDKVMPFKVGNVEGHFGLLNNDKYSLYIIFRGSDGKKDWRDNFKFWKKDVRKLKPYDTMDSKIRVHTGFITQYKTVRDIIHAQVKNTKPRIIYVAGHSLGGALATLCAVDLQYNFCDSKDTVINVACLTYGSPRVGNKYFVKSFNNRIIRSHRHVCRDDIVCHVPYSWMGYRHVATKIQLGKRRWYMPAGYHKDHYPQRYMEYL